MVYSVSAQDELGLAALRGRGWPDGMHAELKRFVADMRKQVGGIGGQTKSTKRKKAPEGEGNESSTSKVRRIVIWDWLVGSTGPDD